MKYDVDDTVFLRLVSGGQVVCSRNQETHSFKIILMIYYVYHRHEFFITNFHFIYMYLHIYLYLFHITSVEMTLFQQFYFHYNADIASLYVI